MNDQPHCPDCNTAPQEPHTTMRYGGILRVFCERCQRWFALAEINKTKAATSAATIH